MAIIYLNLLYSAYVFNKPRPFTDKNVNLLEMFNEFCNLQVSIYYLILCMFQLDQEYLNALGIELNWIVISIMSINIVIVCFHLLLGWIKSYRLKETYQTRKAVFMEKLELKAKLEKNVVRARKQDDPFKIKDLI